MLLLVVSLTLGGVIVCELIALPTAPPEQAAAPVSLLPTVVRPNPVQAVRDRDARLTEVLARPLFSPDRRPVASAARAVNGLARLTGIVITDRQKLAIFAGAPGSRPVVAEEGARLGGYMVRTINGLGVTVVGPEGSMVIRPVFDPTDPKTPPPQRPGMPPPRPGAPPPRG